MHLLFLTHYFPPEGNAPASRVFDVCRRWVKAGHAVTVLTCAPNVPNGIVYDGYKNRLWQVEHTAGIRVVRLWTYLAANKGTARRILNYLSFMFSGVVAGLCVRKPDVILATSPQFFCGWAGAILSCLRRRPFLLEIRDIWPESIESVGAIQHGRLMRLLEWLELKLYAAADHIVTVGDGYRTKLLERGVPLAQIDIISNGVDRELYQERPRPVELVRRYGLDGCFVCSYVGTVGLASGLDVVLRAAAVLKRSGRKDVKFLVVGDGAVLGDLKASAIEQDLQNVIFTGRQPKERIPDFLALSDACLVHLKKQALFTTVMPSKIFEALGMARPVILGVQGCAADFVKKCGGGLCIEPESAEQLLTAIERMRSDPAWAQEAGRLGRDYVQAHFDRDALAMQYLGVLTAVCDRTDPKRSHLTERRLPQAPASGS